MVLEKTLESSLDCKEIKLVNPKRNQSWIFIGRTDAEAEAPILWPPDTKNWLAGKDPDAGKDWRQKEKTTTGGRWLDQWLDHWLDGHEFEQAPGVGYGQGCLVCCSPWGCKELGMTEWLNWTKMGEWQQTLEIKETLQAIIKLSTNSSAFCLHNVTILNNIID